MTGTTESAAARRDTIAQTALTGIPTDLLIGGERRPTGDRRRIEVVDPSTESVLTTISDADEQDGIAAVAAAAEAFRRWRQVAPRRRAEILSRCHALMMARRERIAAVISLENGKSLHDARAEVAYAAEFFRWYAEEAVRITGEMGIAPGGTSRILVQHQPIGVGVLVTPWNFPAAMVTRKLAPALAAGCAVVLKPATQTPLTANLVAELVREAGVPDGVVNVVTTSRPGPVVAAMLHDPRVRALSFTGSTRVGRALLREAADQVLKCSMELGGNAPFIVFADADLDEAVEGLMVAKMRNCGQACTAANRILVERPVADEFAERLGRRMAALRLGAGYDPMTECGPLVDDASLNKVISLVDDAVRQGAAIVTGGQAPKRPGFFYPPTVLHNVPAGAAIAETEIFGPVAAIRAFDSENEVVSIANDTELGLSAYIYGRDLKRGLRVAEQLESGMVAVNRGLVSDPAAPFGGMKQSGIGREGGHHGLMEFTETQYIAVDW